MTWFIDASAIVAILGEEDGWQTLAIRLDEDGDRLWSAISQWESAVALAKRLDMPLDRSQAMVKDFAAQRGFQMVPVGEREGDLASHAAMQFGERSGHPAKLNMGDCFAYACAKANDARLLHKGDDFAPTDLA